MARKKTQPLKIDAERKKLIADAITRSCNRTSVFPSLTMRDIRQLCTQIPSHYDDCIVSFGFVLEDHGEDPVGSGMHNFEMALIPVKNVCVHPDQTHLVLCDDELSEYMTTKCKNTSFQQNDDAVEE